MAVLNSKDYYVKLDLIVFDTLKFVEIPVKEHENHSVIKKRKLHQILHSIIYERIWQESNNKLNTNRTRCWKIVWFN